MNKLLVILGFACLPLAQPALAVHSDINAVIDDCESCHGEKGASTNEEFPIIGGVSEFYLDDNLRIYRDEARPCETEAYPEGPKKGEETDMCTIAKELDDDMIAEVSAWFAEQPFVPAPDQTFDAGKAELGAKVHDRYCEKCHSAGGSEPFDDSGILAGQWRHYLEESFAEIDSGRREQPEKMMIKFNEVSEEERKALIEYYVSGGGR